MTSRTCHIFPQLNNKIPLSIGQFIDARLLAAFSATTLYIYNAIMVYLRGERNAESTMWYVDLYQQDPTPITAQIRETILPSMNEVEEENNVYEMTNKKCIITFLSQAMWNPVPQTWIKSIDAGFSASWTGLTSIMVRQYLDESPETEKGHQRAYRKNMRSKKPSNP